MLEQDESQESMALKVHKILDGFKAFLSELLVSSSDSIEYNSIHVAPLFQPLESIASRSCNLILGLDISLSVSAVGAMTCRSVQLCYLFHVRHVYPFRWDGWQIHLIICVMFYPYAYGEWLAHPSLFHV